MNATRTRIRFLALIALLSFITAARAETFTVERRDVSDPKAVFATVESTNVVPARARIGGTVASLLIDEGAHVDAGETIAAIGDEKLALQLQSMDAQIAGLRAQMEKAGTDRTRAEDLFSRGTIPRIRLDDANTALDVAANALKSQRAQRRVIAQQQAEGAVLAPTSGRVLTVTVTSGTVVMPGEPIAMIAEANYVLRLRLPERHARFLEIGDEIRLATPEDPQGAPPRIGRIVTVYPEIADGRVIADASIEGLGDYFVGERVRVWVSTGMRSAMVVPAHFITTRYGVDFAVIESGTGAPREIPIQRGQAHALPDMPEGIEILSGLQAGDILVAP